MTASAPEAPMRIQLRKEQEKAALRALQNEQKSPKKWLLYSFVGVLPVFLGLFTLLSIALEIRNETVGTSLSLPKNLPNYIKDCVPYFFLFIFLEVAVCHLTSRKYYRLNDAVSSISMGVQQFSFGMFTRALGIFPYAYLHNKYQIASLPDCWWSWVLMFLCVEYGYYWFHRFSHEWNALWAAHIVHHSSQEYNLSTSLRQGLLQPVFSWVFYLPFAFFFPVRLYVAHSQINAIYQFWIHTRVIKKLPWIVELIFNTPSHHRVHHGRNGQYIDKNYGGTLIIFDRLFGTFEPEDEEVVYGVTHDLGTWNTLYLQFHHWEEMWQTMKRTPGLWNKVRVFLDLGPGYNYQVLYCRLIENPPPPITAEREIKYNSTVPNLALSIYCFVQFTVMVAFGFFGVVVAANQDYYFKMILFVVINYQLLSLSFLFDQRSCCVAMETVRLYLTLACFILYLAPAPGWDGLSWWPYSSQGFFKDSEHLVPYCWIAIVFTVLSALWLWLASNGFHKKVASSAEKSTS